MDPAILEPVARARTRPQQRAPRVTGNLPLSADAAAKAVLQNLALIRALAKNGEFLQARELCGAALADQQPLISSRPELLRETFAALILAQGFRLLSRLAMAALGREVRVIARGDREPSRACLSHRVEHGRTVFVFDTGNGDGSPPDEEQARHWGEMIATGIGGTRQDDQVTVTGAPRWDRRPVWP